MKRFIMVPILGALFFHSNLNGQVPAWPDLYNPFSLHTFHVQTIDPNDFDVIKADTTYDIEVPAIFGLKTRPL